MSRLPSVPLQPQARPVDAYNAPDAAPPRGSSLASLAYALQSIEPRILGVMDQITQGHQQASQIRARADAAKYKSLTDLRQAVKDGKLNESDNPWYSVQLKQEVARNTAANAIVTMRDKYLKDPKLRYSDDPQVVGQFADAELGSLLQGSDVWETEALNPIIQNAKNELLQAHVAIRGRERIEEREIASKQEIANILSTVDAGLWQAANDPSDPHHAEAKAELDAKMPAVRQQLQGKLNEMLKTVSPAQANRWAKEAIFDAAHERESGEFARSLWGSMTTEDGKTALMSDDDKVRLRELDRRVSDLKVHKIAQEEQMERIALRKREKVIGAIINKKMAEDPNFDLQQAISAGELKDQDPEVVDAVIARVAQNYNARRGLKEAVKGEELDKIIGKIGKAMIDPNTPLDPALKLKYIDLLMTVGGSRGVGLVQEFASVEDRLANMQWAQITSPKVKADLMSRLAEGSLSLDKGGVNELNQLALSRQISPQDHAYFINAVLQDRNRETRDGITDALPQYQRRIADLVVAKGVSDGKYADRSEASQDLELEERVSKAVFEFTKDARTKIGSKEWKQMSEPDRQKFLDERLDDWSKRTGGFTSQQYDQWVADQQRKAEAEKNKPKEVNPVKPEDSKDKRLTQLKSLHDTAVESIAEDDIKEVFRIADLPVAPEARVIDIAEKRRTTIRDSWIHSWTDAGHKEWLQRPENQAIRNDFVAQVVRARRDSNPNISRTGMDAIRLPKEDYEKAEVENWQKALQEVSTRGLVIQFRDMPGQLKKLVEQYKGQSTIPPSDKIRMLELYNNLRSYAEARIHIGWTPDEVKELGKDAWKDHVMFANEPDLRARGPEVMKTLGLSMNPATMKSFQDSQTALLAKIRDVRD